MNEYPEKELRERYEKLPPSLKSALSDPEISERILEIGRRVQILNEDLGGLTQICGLVFIGVLPLEILQRELEERLMLSEERSKSLAENLKSEVFSQYKETLASIRKPEEVKVEKPEEVKLKELLREFKARGEEPKSHEEKEEIKENFSERKKSTEQTAEEKIAIKEELLKKKKSDRYREPIEGIGETKKARVVKEEGRIKKIF